MKKLEFIFRVANTEKDGAGHFSRCLSIIQNLKGKNCLLVLDRNTDFFLKRLQNYNIDIYDFNSSVKKEVKCKICILDGYNFNKEEKDYWRKSSECLVVIDDIYRKHDYADLIVNLGVQNNIKKINNVKLISGLEYSLLEKKIIKIAKTYFIKKRVENIMISFGFRDSLNLTLKVLKFLKKLEKKLVNIKISIVLGSDAKGLIKVKEFLDSFNMQNDLLIDINNIQYYLGKTDFIIGSGGIGLLERVKIGIPSITILSARNQLNQTKILEEKRTSLFFNKDKIYTKKFKYSFLEYIHNHSLRSDMYKNCKKLLNNNGSVKLLKKIQDHNYKKNG